MLYNEKLENLKDSEIKTRAMFILANAYGEARRKGYKMVDLDLFGQKDDTVREILKDMSDFGICECTVSNSGSDLMAQIGIFYEEGWQIETVTKINTGKAWSQEKTALHFYNSNIEWPHFEFSEQEAE